MTTEELQDLVDRSLFATLAYADENGDIQVRRVFCTWHRGLSGHLISTNTGSASSTGISAGISRQEPSASCFSSVNFSTRKYQPTLLHTV